MDLLTLSFGNSRWDVATAARMPIGTDVEAVVRPEAIKLSDAKRGFPGQVVSSTYLGSKIDYLVRVGDQTLKVVQSDPSFGTRFAVGADVDVSLPHVGVQVLGPTDRRSVS
jgi:ABC-type Fe3+/spermidine/putrescine transport system ATPase subunit